MSFQKVRRTFVTFCELYRPNTLPCDRLQNIACKSIYILVRLASQNRNSWCRWLAHADGNREVAGYEAKKDLKMGSWCSWLAPWPVKPEVAGSSPVGPAIYGRLLADERVTFFCFWDFLLNVRGRGECFTHTFFEISGDLLKPKCCQIKHLDYPVIGNDISP